MKHNKNKALYESIMRQVGKVVKAALNEQSSERMMRVADVEYNDDDGYDCHVLVRVKPDDTEDDIEQALSDEGMLYVWVNDIDTILVNHDVDMYQVVKVLDD